MSSCKKKAVCFVCDKIFSTQFNLNKHSKKVHKSKPKIVTYDQSKWNYKCLESGCNSSFQRNIDFINHLSEDHHINMQNEIMTFLNNEDFLAWKHLIEKQDKSNYIILRSYKSHGKLVRYYTCNRSGKQSSNSNNVRFPKSQGSCKLNRFCTSSIKVIEGKNFLVTWIRTHYGHNIDLQHIRIPKIDRSVIASKLTLGVPPSRILDSYRDKIQENINREDLITRKDIQNIKNSYQINISEGGTRTEGILQSSNLDAMKLSTEYVNKSDILRQNFSAKIIKTMAKLQNADKYKLTDEVILQIESHLATVEKLLELRSTFDHSM